MIADVGLPGHNGIWLLQEIRRWQGGHVPVVALTGYVSPADMQRFRGVGFDGHLAKPFDLDDIGEIIAAMTGRL